MEILLLKDSKNNPTRFIEIHFKLSKEVVLPTFNASKGRFKDFFDLFIKRIYEQSGVEYIDVLRSIKDIKEAEKYVVKYLNDILDINLNEFRTDDKIESFNEVYVSEFISTFIKAVKLASPTFTDEDDDDPFKTQPEQEVEIIDLTHLLVDEENVFSVDYEQQTQDVVGEVDNEEIYKPKTYPINPEVLTGVFTEEQLNNAVNEFLESRDKFKDSLEMSNMYNEKIKKLQHEVRLRKEVKKLELLSTELEILSLEISQILLKDKQKKRP